jgi:thymidylate synthase (FAD)
MDVEFIEQSHEIIHVSGGWQLMAKVARECYDSTSKGEESDKELVRDLLKKDHQQTELGWMVVRIVCDRGISHELVRHRLFTFAQQSQRYVNYGNKGFKFILPEGLTGLLEVGMKSQCHKAADYYAVLTDDYEPIKPEIARYVLPNATATVIVAGGNVREWRHFFRLRCDKHAHPMMQKLARGILRDAKEQMPVVFDDLEAGE